MSLRKLLLLAAAVMAVVSCKDDEEETLPSLEGMVVFYAPDFIEPGKTLTMTPKGVEHPEDKGVGYYWKVSPGSYVDTVRYENGLTIDGKPSDGTLTYTFPDSLATYTVTCYAFANGYSGLSGRQVVTTVKGGIDGSVTGTGISVNDDHVTVDGNNYYYVRIGALDWFRNNLLTGQGGAAYANVEVMADVLGKFYCHDDALAACPEGWRLPTEEDWLSLAKELGSEAGKYELIPDMASKLMVDVYFNGNQMWEYWPEVGEKTNSSRMSVIPAGFANLGVRESDGSYRDVESNGVYEYATFWTADKADDGMAYYRYLICDQAGMMIGKGDPEAFGANVRCVRDAE
ncbi:MAG: hypothetical protein IJ394_03035 [Bacteroidales bacterium]|nr:hypothetical protein [Bacteroidales bacterium]